MDTIESKSQNRGIVMFAGIMSAVVSSFPIILSLGEVADFLAIEPFFPGFVFGIVLCLLFPVLVERPARLSEWLVVVSVCFFGYLIARTVGYFLTVLSFGLFLISFSIAGILGGLFVFLAIKEALLLRTKYMGSFILWGFLLGLFSSFFFQVLYVGDPGIGIALETVTTGSFFAFLALFFIWQTGMFFVIQSLIHRQKKKGDIVPHPDAPPPPAPPLDA